mmetsp:Transcript_136008/g.322270  ORF Transcript_136008/g.322270 Transcript_136008/m.322270 type:complete len:232 (-) Transcript_136008:530-1225(-)
MRRKPKALLQHHGLVVWARVAQGEDVLGLDSPDLRLLLLCVGVVLPVSQQVHEEHNHFPFKGVPQDVTRVVVRIARTGRCVHFHVPQRGNGANLAAARALVEEVHHRVLHSLQAPVPSLSELGESAAFPRALFQHVDQRSRAKGQLPVVQARKAVGPSLHGGDAGEGLIRTFAISLLVDATGTEPRQEAPEGGELCVEVLQGLHLSLQHVQGLLCIIGQGQQLPQLRLGIL